MITFTIIIYFMGYIATAELGAQIEADKHLTENTAIIVFNITLLLFWWAIIAWGLARRLYK